MADTTTGTAGSSLGAAGGTSTSGLSPWIAPYITDYLGKAQALAGEQYQPYQGQLTAGPSQLQSQAFQGIGALTVPSQFGMASDMAAMAGMNAMNMGYTPGMFFSGFQAPGAYMPTSYTSQFAAPGAYQSGQFDAGFNAPSAYTAGSFTNRFDAPDSYTAADFSGAGFNAPQTYAPVAESFTGQGVAERYMNPFLETSLQPQLKELQRQSTLNLQPQLAKLTAAGGYGGSREALLRAEAQRNLLDKTSDVTGRAYETAFGQAQQQFNAEQQRKVQEAQFGAQQGMTSAELAARYGLDAARAAEQSRQFGAQQGMTAADLMARYGLSADQAYEASRQFAAQQGMTAADLASRYAMAEQQAREASRQFGAQQGMTAADLMARYGLSAEQAREASRQFGAQQGMTAADLTARYGLDAQRLAEQSRQFGAGYGLDALKTGLSSAQLLGQLGQQQQQSQLQALDQMLKGGQIQRDITSEGTKADYEEFLRQREFPYKQLQFQRDMISGLPVGAVTNTPPQLSGVAQLISAAGGIDKLLKATGQKDLGSLLENLFGGNLGGGEG